MKQVYGLNSKRFKKKLNPLPIRSPQRKGRCMALQCGPSQLRARWRQRRGWDVSGHNIALGDILRDIAHCRLTYHRLGSRGGIHRHLQRWGHRWHLQPWLEVCGHCTLRHLRWRHRQSAHRHKICPRAQCVGARSLGQREAPSSTGTLIRAPTY